jgi:hypothetical protein
MHKKWNLHDKRFSRRLLNDKTKERNNLDWKRILQVNNKNIKRRRRQRFKRPKQKLKLDERNGGKN